MTLILQHRFDVSYVNAYSSRDLPLHFLFSSFWGGQEGSFLLWCFMGALIGLVVWAVGGASLPLLAIGLLAWGYGGGPVISGQQARLIMANAGAGSASVAGSSCARATSSCARASSRRSTRPAPRSLTG